jgi:hypothetical protein
LDDLSALGEDRVSRGLDVSGGDRVLEELMCDLDLPGFCRDEGIAFLWLCMLGPDEEDFSHIATAVARGQMRPEDMLLVMNEVAIRSGQNPAGAFDFIHARADFEEMARAGAKVLYLPRLPCMDKLRGNRLDFYRVAAGGPGPNGKRDAVLQYMTKRWLADIEAGYAKLGIADRLP